jgi:hypothetical protein
VLGSLGFGLVGRTVGRSCRWAGTPAAREGGHRGCRSTVRGGSGKGETGRLAFVDAKEGIGGADGRGEPAEERRTVEDCGRSGRSGAQGGGGAWGKGDGPI